MNCAPKQYRKHQHKDTRAQNVTSSQYERVHIQESLNQQMKVMHQHFGYRKSLQVPTASTLLLKS